MWNSTHPIKPVILNILILSGVPVGGANKPLHQVKQAKLAVMNPLLPTTIAAVLLVGCGKAKSANVYYGWN